VSALTKIFVVLLVVLSIVETAGMVVWVNRTPSYLEAQKQLNAKWNAAKAEATKANAELGMTSANMSSMQLAMQKQIDAERQEIDQLKSDVAGRDTQIASLTASLAQATVAQKSATDALAVAQKTIDQQNTAIADDRKNQLDLQKRAAELSFALNTRTNEFESADRQYKDAMEQITQLQSENQKQADALRKSGVSINNPRVINAEPLVRVEGVVRSKEQIGGVPYATISVGAADQVTKGMQFKVIDPQSHDPFLGYLIVDRVEPHEAIGHLTGPRVDEVHPGVDVRTQL
jgi:hypothetical protein